MHEVAGGLLTFAVQKVDDLGVDSTETGSRLDIVTMQLTVNEVAASELCMRIPVDELGGVSCI